MFRPVGKWQKYDKHPLVRQRFDVIRKHVAGKSVLDCGPAGEEVMPDEPWWEDVFLHKKIKDVARECVGVDNDRPTIDKLNAMGYDIRFGDVEELDLGRRFETVVAGEFIEHLSNPGKFLECVKAHLEEDGVLVMSTPNAWAIGNLIRSLLGRKVIVNLGHVNWYDEVMITQLLNRHGFEVVEFYWAQRVFRRTTHLVRWFPHWALNFVVVAKVAKPS